MESIAEEVARCKAYGKIHQELRTKPMDRFERQNAEMMLRFYGRPE
jgi:hypothetical protein